MKTRFALIAGSLTTLTAAAAAAYPAPEITTLGACVEAKTNYLPGTTSRPYTMSGSCDASLGGTVEIYDQQKDFPLFGPLATTPCQGDGTWSVSFDPTPSLHALRDGYRRDDDPPAVSVPPSDGRQLSLRKSFRVTQAYVDALWRRRRTASAVARPHLCQLGSPTVFNNRVVQVAPGQFTVFPGQCRPEHLPVWPYDFHVLRFVGGCTGGTRVTVAMDTGDVLGSTTCTVEGAENLGLYDLVAYYPFPGLFRGFLRADNLETNSDSPQPSSSPIFAFSTCPSEPNVPHWPDLDFWRFVPVPQQFGP